jgi:hypothetical protein
MWSPALAPLCFQEFAFVCFADGCCDYHRLFYAWCDFAVSAYDCGSKFLGCFVDLSCQTLELGNGGVLG